MNVKAGPPSDWRASSAAAATGLVCYLNTLGHQFVFDDLEVIVRNPLVAAGVSGIGRIFTSHYWSHVTPTGDLYRPLTMASYALNHSAGGLDPFGYHLVNVLLHCLCCALLALLGCRLGLTPGRAAAAGILFAAHPIHTEAVAGVVGRAELLAAAGVMGAWCLHLRPPRSSGPAPARLAAIGALFAAGLLSKENAVVLPALMAAGDLLRRRRERFPLRGALPSYLVCGAVAGAWLLGRAILLEPAQPGTPSESLFAATPPLFRILTAFSVLGRYLGLLVLPVGLSADYSFEQIPLVTSLLDPLAAGSAVLLALLTAAAIHRTAISRTAGVDGAGALVFLIAILPVSNLIVPIGTIMGERLLYLPSAGFCLALAALWPERAPRAAGVAATGLLALACSGLTLARNADWKDQLTLFSRTVQTSPRSAKAHFNLGVALQESGRIDEALQQYREALAIRPDDARSLHNAGLLLAGLDRLPEAAASLEAAATADPSLPQLFTNLGVVYSRQGRPQAAETALGRAVRADPADAAAAYNLATLLLARESPDARQAVALLERARGLDPRDPDTRFQLGLAYRLSGRLQEAILELGEALGLSPGLAEAHLQLALCHLAAGDLAPAAQEASRARAAGLDLPAELSSLLASPPGGSAGRTP